MNTESLIDDFTRIAVLAGVEILPGAIRAEKLPAPHVPPKELSPAKVVAAYFCSLGNRCLKVGKVGQRTWMNRGRVLFLS